MNKIIYMFAMIIAVVTLVLTNISGISLFTGIIRSAIVFLGVLFVFFIAGHLLRLGILLVNQKPKATKDDN